MHSSKAQFSLADSKGINAYLGKRNCILDNHFVMLVCRGCHEISIILHGHLKSMKCWARPFGLCGRIRYTLFAQFNTYGRRRIKSERNDRTLAVEGDIFCLTWLVLLYIQCIIDVLDIRMRRSFPFQNACAISWLPMSAWASIVRTETPATVWLPLMATVTWHVGGSSLFQVIVSINVRLIRGEPRTICAMVPK